jgi:hypothetical protein
VACGRLHDSRVANTCLSHGVYQRSNPVSPDCSKLHGHSSQKQTSESIISARFPVFPERDSSLASLRRMRQEQPRRPSDQHQAAAAAGGAQEQAGSVRYGDVFPMSIGLAEQPVAPRDAATMQSAETMVFGQTLKGGPAAAMQSAATVATANERMGVVEHDQATEATTVQGVTFAESRVPGGRMVTEFVAGQAVGQYLASEDAAAAGAGGGGAEDLTKVTIGEALEATALAAGDMPVERSDAAAIQAAEARATGLNANVPGGLAAQAQSAAVANETAARDEDKVTLGDVLAVHTHDALLLMRSLCYS